MTEIWCKDFLTIEMYTKVPHHKNSHLISLIDSAIDLKRRSTLRIKIFWVKKASGHKPQKCLSWSKISKNSFKVQEEGTSCWIKVSDINYISKIIWQLFINIKLFIKNTTLSIKWLKERLVLQPIKWKGVFFWNQKGIRRKRTFSKEKHIIGKKERQFSLRTLTFLHIFSK